MDSTQTQCTFDVSLWADTRILGIDRLIGASSMMNEINVQEYEEVVMDDRCLFFPPKLYTNENFVVNQEKTLLICATIDS